MMRLSAGEHVVRWVATRTNEYGNFGCATAVGAERFIDGEWRLVGGVVYAEWNGPNVVCHIASEGRNWLTRAFLGLIFDYPFRQLKCKRMTACVGEGNAASRRFVEHLGFTLEAELAGAHPTGNLRIYRLWRDDCRYLEAPYAPLRTDLLRAAA